MIIVICLLMEHKSLSLKLLSLNSLILNGNFLTQFCLRRISNGYSATDSTEISLNGNM